MVFSSDASRRISFTTTSFFRWNSLAASSKVSTWSGFKSLKHSSTSPWCKKSTECKIQLTFRLHGWNFARLSTMFLTFPRKCSDFLGIIRLTSLFAVAVTSITTTGTYAPISTCSSCSSQRERSAPLGALRSSRWFRARYTLNASRPMPLLANHKRNGWSDEAVISLFLLMRT